MINLDLLDTKTKEVLRESQWSENRKINVAEIEKILSAEGYSSFEYSTKILESFEGLHIKSSLVNKLNQYTGEIEFCALDAGSGEFDRLKVFEAIAKELLFPIGLVYGQWFLYVGVSKKVYMGDYEKLYLLGNNIEQFLLNLISLGNKPKIIED